MVSKIIPFIKVARVTTLGCLFNSFTCPRAAIREVISCNPLIVLCSYTMTIGNDVPVIWDNDANVRRFEYGEHL